MTKQTTIVVIGALRVKNTAPDWFDALKSASTSSDQLSIQNISFQFLHKTHLVGTDIRTA